MQQLRAEAARGARGGSDRKLPSGGTVVVRAMAGAAAARADPNDVFFSTAGAPVGDAPPAAPLIAVQVALAARIDAPDARVILAAAADAVCDVLVLSQCGVTPAALEALCSSRRWRMVRFARCDLGDAGALAAARGLAVSNSRSSAPRAAGAPALMRLPLQVLDVSDSQVGDAGALALGEAVARSDVERVCLDRNPLSRAGVGAFSRAVVRGRFIDVVSLRGVVSAHGGGGARAPPPTPKLGEEILAAARAAARVPRVISIAGSGVDPQHTFALADPARRFTSHERVLAMAAAAHGRGGGAVPAARLVARWQGEIMWRIMELLYTMERAPAPDEDTSGGEDEGDTSGEEEEA